MTKVKDRDEIERLWRENVSLREIAEHFNMTRSGVKAAAKRFGLPTRGQPKGGSNRVRPVVIRGRDFETQADDARFMEVQSLVHNLIERHGATHIGLEAPVQAGRNSAKVNGLLMGLSAVVRGWVYRKGVPVEMFPVPTIKKHFIGSARLPRAEAKQAAIAMCERRGWTPDDDNQADAAAVWDLMCARLDPAYAAATAPLFSGGR